MIPLLFCLYQFLLFMMTLKFLPPLFPYYHLSHLIHFLQPLYPHKYHKLLEDQKEKFKDQANIKIFMLVIYHQLLPVTLQVVFIP